jgi:2,3-bisphosphoglycerate-independent phosphoglycerate mutase
LDAGTGRQGLNIALDPHASAIIARRHPAGRHAVSRPKPVLLLILDGWGHRDDPADNAIAQATLPHWRKLLADCPHTLIHTSGLQVGLPDGQMGIRKSGT